MGTRADFYVGRGESAEWLGSISWDGYPAGMPWELLQTLNESMFRREVAKFIESREDGTKPEMGWPWPWSNSQTTDYSYAFDDGQVWASCFGHQWFDPNNPPESEDDDEDPEMRGDKVGFPDMKERQKVAMGKRSGLLVITQKGCE